MGNDAIYVNYDYASQLGITTNGSNWLWAAFAVMLLSDLIVIGWHFTVPRGQRVFHQLGAIILTTASIAYFSMASNLGSTPIATEFRNLGYPAGTLRQIWYVRYIDWAITTPALLLELALASGLPLSDIITLVFFDLVMIITGLVGALVASSYKWGYFVFGNFALFYIWWVLLGPARTSAGLLGPGFKKSFTSSAAFLSFIWILYPIAWGLADGSSTIWPDAEMVFYGVLDVIAKPVYIFFHLFSLSKLDLTALQLQSGKFSSSAGTSSSHDHSEKPSRGFGNHTVNAAHTHETPVARGGEPTHAGAKKGGLFGRKGHYDATAPAGTHHTGAAPVNVAQPVDASNPRMSEATVADRV